MEFADWLRMITKKNGMPLADMTVKHYCDGITIISKTMFKTGTIDKKLEDMNIYELDIAIFLIMKDKSFLLKDKTGNRMYSSALKKYRCFKYCNTDLEEQDIIIEKSIKKDKSLKVTEKEAIIKARRGQGLYRDRLIKKYDHKCIMTKISVEEVLVASHIKPWAVCTNAERIDCNNGLLLSATYDKLFDSGLITFDKKGRLKVSELINKNNAEKLNIQNGQAYDLKYTREMEVYLDYHNHIVFVG